MTVITVPGPVGLGGLGERDDRVEDLAGVPTTGGCASWWVNGPRSATSSDVASWAARGLEAANPAGDGDG
jgi:hypothetical protein